MDLKNIWQQYVNLIIKFAPKPPLPAAIGIDIGTSSIKVVELARTNSALEVRNFAVKFFEPSALPTILQQVLTDLKITDQTLITAVSGKGTLIRYIDMPRMSNDELRKSLVFELDKYFPFDPTSIYYDCHILDQELKDKKMSALVTAVKKEMVDERLKVFKQTGFDIDKITTNAIATANAFSELSAVDTNQHAKALLDIGGSLSNLMILHQQSPRFTRDIYIGATEMTKQIANVLGVDLPTAEAIKLKGDRREEVLQSCEDVIANLVGEVRLSLDYFITERNINVDELYLVGGGAQLAGLSGVFEKHLGIPVKTWQPLTGLKLSEKVGQTDIFNYSSQLSVSIGLALGGL